jgi:twitching motility two-component system response regulator PilH
MSRVLVIDDDPSVTRLLEEHLTNEGHEVASAHLAEEGFKRATEAPPELIFLDVMLPDATGFQMVGRLRQNPITQTIPIIMMSGTARYPNQQQIGKSMGANDYILKPFDILELGDRVHHLIEMYRVKQLLGEPPPAAPIQETAAKEPEPVAAETAPIAPETEPVVPEPEMTAAEPPIFAPEPEPAAPTPSEPLETAPEPVLPFDPIAEPGKEPERPVDSRLLWVTSLFAVHLVLAGAAAEADVFRAITTIAGGWAMLLGLLTGTCALFRIQIEGRQALRILGWASIPIVLRAAANLFGIIPDPAMISTNLFWLRPLDVFEIAVGVILAISFHRLPGASLKKCIFAVPAIALAWALCSRGYFRPF